MATNTKVSKSNGYRLHTADAPCPSWVQALSLGLDSEIPIHRYLYIDPERTFGCPQARLQSVKGVVSLLEEHMQALFDQIAAAAADRQEPQVMSSFGFTQMSLFKKTKPCSGIAQGTQTLCRPSVTALGTSSF